MTTTTRSLKALAAQVLAQELEVEQASGTPWNTPPEGGNRDTPPRSTDQGCSAFQRPRGGTVEHDEQEKDTPLSSTYRRRMTEATSWDDLYAVLAEVDGACVNGVISHDDVAALDGFAADRSHDIPQHAEDGHLSELFARRPVLRVRSRLLGEVVVWLSNEAEAPEGTDEVVYREAELRRLVGREPEMIQAIHRAKKALAGEIEG